MLYSPGCSCCCGCVLCSVPQQTLHVVLAADGLSCCEHLAADVTCYSDCEWRGGAGTCCGFALTVIVTLEVRAGGIVWVVVRLEQTGTGNFEKWEASLGSVAPVNCQFNSLSVAHVSTGGAGVPCCVWENGYIGTVPPVDCGFCTPTTGDIPTFFLVEMNGVGNDKCHEVFSPAATGCAGYDGTYLVPRKGLTACTWELALPKLVNCVSVTNVYLRVSITGPQATPTVAAVLIFEQVLGGTFTVGEIRWSKTYATPKNCNTIEETVVPGVDFYAGPGSPTGDNTCTGVGATAHFVAIP